MEEIMARLPGTKNKKFSTFAFKSAEDRAYFIRMNLPADAPYTVYVQPSLFNSAIQWYYLRIELPESTQKEV